MIYDICIVGGGAAGLMAACVASQHSKKVIILERNHKLGRKINITGKGKCNITHDTDRQGILDNVVSNPKFVYSALTAWNPQDTIGFFDSIGLKTIVTPQGRVFPYSGLASDVSCALISHATAHGTKLVTNSKVKSVDKHTKESEGKVSSAELNGEYCCQALLAAGRGKGYDTYFVLKTHGDVYWARRVILSCGGMSYPLTGSDGYGYVLSRQFGHTIIQPVSALVQIEFDNCPPLQGLSLRDIRLTFDNGTHRVHAQGDIVFTDSGISGPAAHSLSSLINRLPLDGVVSVDLYKDCDIQEVVRMIAELFYSHSNKQLSNALHKILPHSMVAYILRILNIGNMRVHSVTRAERQQLSQLLKNIPFDVSKLGDIERGITTAGGVNTQEIDPKTMQSKIVDGLYFAGEMIDVDGLTGGYNMQLSLSTGYLAGLSSTRSLSAVDN